MTKEERAEVLAVCARMRKGPHYGPDVRKFSYEDVDRVRAAFENLTMHVDALCAQIDQLEEELSRTKANALAVFRDLNAARAESVALKVQLKGTFRYTYRGEMEPKKFDLDD